MLAGGASMIGANQTDAVQAAVGQERINLELNRREPNVLEVSMGRRGTKKVRLSPPDGHVVAV